MENKKRFTERPHWVQGRIRGQSLVEFALILPVLLLSLFVIIELARVLHAWMAIENGARSGVRYAVTGEYDPTNCINGFSGDKCLFPTDENGARVESIHDQAWAGSSSIVRVGESEAAADEPYFFKVTVCDPDFIDTPDSTFDESICPGVEDPGGPGDLVAVVLEFNHPMILPGLSSIWPQLRLSARRDATVETFRITSSSGSPPTVIAPPPQFTNTAPPPPTPIPTQPQPECSEIGFTNWKWYASRFYVLIRDGNPQDGYITSFTVSFPAHQDGRNYYIDVIDYNPDSTDTNWEYRVTNGNHADSPFVKSYSAPNNFWVSPPGYNKSRISVDFGGDLPGGQLPNGNYTVQLVVQYPGYTDDSGGVKECYPLASKNRNSTVATSTARSGDGDDDDPTPEFPPTNTPPGPSTAIPPTDPPPTARD